MRFAKEHWFAILVVIAIAAVALWKFRFSLNIWTPTAKLGQEVGPLGTRYKDASGVVRKIATIGGRANNDDPEA